MPEPTVRTIGGLKTLAYWEDFLNQLRAKTNDGSGLGLIATIEKPPRQEGNDPTIQELFYAADLGPCVIEIPKGAEHSPVTDSPIGEYHHVRLGGRASGISVHLRGPKGDDALVVTGRIKVGVRTVHIKDADKRQASPRLVWKNYMFFLDVFPLEEGDPKPKQRIVLEDPASMMYSRPEALMFGGESRIFATRSQDWNPREERGVNQDIRVREILTEADLAGGEIAHQDSGGGTSMGDALRASGLTLIQGGQPVAQA